MAKLYIIPGSKPPDTTAQKVRNRIKAMPKPASMIQCHRCSGREVIETKIGVMFKNGRPSGGTKTLICATCHRGGERVVLA
ncbi:hypothetical protein [Nevskia ramosa]|uniref:hypothetical protein n=1 Tax=Nevskia ramosa TaxID=64002 RepID=UPI003D0E37FA